LIEAKGYQKSGQMGFESLDFSGTEQDGERRFKMQECHEQADWQSFIRP
jgi:hypothetical protein